MTRRAQALAPTDPVAHFNESMLRYERLETGGVHPRRPPRASR